MRRGVKIITVSGIIMMIINLILNHYGIINGNGRRKKAQENDLSNKYGSDILGESEKKIPKGYLVWSPKCKILDINAWDKSILPYIKPVKPFVCSKLPLLTYIEMRKNVGNVLKVNKTAENSYRPKKTDKINCCYSVITRINQSLSDFNSKADSKYSLSDCIHFQNEIILSNATEFIFVKCLAMRKDQPKGKEVYRNAHAMIPILPKITERISQTQNSKRLNVMIIGVDGVSRLNVRRTMPNTLKYLQRNEWVELHGYNKMAENTFPNLMAILSGENYVETYNSISNNYSVPMDIFSIIWQDYKKNGYVTAYAEDTPNIQTFNYMQTGFVEQPTDYYMRPFMLAAHNLLPKRFQDGLPVCVGPVCVVDHIFDYAKSFSKTFKDHNYFGLFWLNSLSHNNVNVPTVLDVPLMNFLKDLSDIGTYDNTLVLLLSDHGIRFGPIRETFVGYYEERLPFMFIWVPKWFRKKYPKKYESLLVNRNRLTNPYDVYVTIKRLLDEDYEDGVTRPISKACPKCVSLFEKVPWDRGCDNAGIAPQWCMCPNFKKLNVEDPATIQIGEFLFQFILKATQELIAKAGVNENLCAKRTLSKIVWNYLGITKSYSSENGTVKGDHYSILIQLNPGKALFQAMIQKNQTGDEKPRMRILEPVIRLDSYWNVSKCVGSRQLKVYCHCLMNRFF